MGNYKSKSIPLNGNRKLINVVKKAGLKTYHPKGCWNGFGYEMLPLEVEINSLSEMRKFNKIKRELEGNCRKAEAIKDTKYTELAHDSAVIAECIYSINKEAKRLRDRIDDYKDELFRCSSYDDYYDDSYYNNYHVNNKSQKHSAMHSAIYKKNRLYALKDKCLKKLISEENISPIGYHKFSDANRDYYEICGFGFHLNECNSLNELGVIEDEISSARKRSIPPQKAEEILNIYLNMQAA